MDISESEKLACYLLDGINYDSNEVKLSKSQQLPSDKPAPVPFFVTNPNISSKSSINSQRNRYLKLITESKDSASENKMPKITDTIGRQQEECDKNLESDYQLLEIEHQVLEDDYQALEKKHQHLKSEYRLLGKDYDILERDYEVLEEKYKAQTEKNHEQEDTISSLKTESAEFRKLKTQNKFLMDYYKHEYELRLQDPQITEKRFENLLKNTIKEIGIHEDVCAICMTEAPRGMLVPCRHEAVCVKCIEIGEFDECPICRTKIKFIV